MQLRAAVVLLAVLPLLVASVAVGWVVQQRSQVLAQMHLEAIEPVLLAARKSELQAKLNLGRSAIAHLVRDGVALGDEKQRALDILRRLEFGHDGFFFVYTFDGQPLIEPRLGYGAGPAPALPLPRMLQQARSGGGYVEFGWPRPSSGQVETKLGYVEPIAGWEWMLGTGTYVDEPEQARARLAEASAGAALDTLARIAGVGGLATLAVGGLALLVNLNEQRKADAQLRVMARQIVTSQEDERARVARELHDGVSQSLVSAKFVFESALERARQSGAGPPALGAALEGGVARLRDVLGEVRRISHGRRPAVLDDLGLARALEHLAEEWGRRNALPVVVNAELSGPLPDAVATALFRVAQEALGNIERHAEAGGVRLLLEHSARGLLLAISDDGLGFDAEALLRAPRLGLGLTHMRERVQSLGGQFELRSWRGGTTVRAWMPAASLT